METLEAAFWITIGLLIHTYFGYPLFLTCLGWLYGGYDVENKRSNLPKVDLVIAAFNEENVIGDKLMNCLALDYPNELLQIWIASDGSSDGTKEMVKRYEKEHDRIHLLDCQRSGKAATLNTAMMHVEGEIVVFSDANTEYEPNTLKYLVRHFAYADIGCVCGRLIYRNPGGVVSGKGESFYWKYETFLKKLESKIGYVAGANGAIYAIRRELFEHLPLRTINDDFTVSMGIVRRGFKCIYEEKALAYEDVAPTAKSEFKRHIRDGAGHYLAITQLLGLLNPFLGVRSFIYWSHRILRWIAPFLLIFAFVGNLGLLSIPFYRVTFVLQSAFYVSASFGFVIANKGGLTFFLYIPFYFCNLNLALLRGFFRVLTGRQKMVWESTDRVLRDK